MATKSRLRSRSPLSSSDRFETFLTRIKTHSHTGGCHCGGLRWSLDTDVPLVDFTPRACDCDFCARHRAAWISDSKGTLILRIVRAGVLQRYRQGSDQAEFMICRECGVLVAVMAKHTQGALFGAVNRNAFDRREFPAETIVSPQRLSAEAKLARWIEIWTPTQIQVEYPES